MRFNTKTLKQRGGELTIEQKLALDALNESGKLEEIEKRKQDIQNFENSPTNLLLRRMNVHAKEVLEYLHVDLEGKPIKSDAQGQVLDFDAVEPDAQEQKTGLLSGFGRAVASMVRPRVRKAASTTPPASSPQPAAPSAYSSQPAPPQPRTASRMVSRFTESTIGTQKFNEILKKRLLKADHTFFDEIKNEAEGIITDEEYEELVLKLKVEVGTSLDQASPASPSPAAPSPVAPSPAAPSPQDPRGRTSTRGGPPVTGTSGTSRAVRPAPTPRSASLPRAPRT
jgi:hypothetical protein